MESAPDPDTSPPPRLETGSALASVKKPAWNIPATLNGPIETGPPVIDENSWPALSESAKSPLKVSDGSAAGSTSASSLSPSKPHLTSPNPNSSNTNPNSPSRSKPSKRTILPTNSNSPPNPNSDSNSPLENTDQNAPSRQPNNRTRGGYNGNNNNRRGNNNSSNNGRGGGGNRGQFRNLNGPSVAPPPPHGYAVPPVYVRPPPPPPLPGTVSVPFMAAPPAVPVRPPPFGAPIVYPEMPPSPVYYAQGPGQVPPFVPAGAPVFLPPLDHQRTALLKQIDYYFSSDNLCKDTWLRSQMDEQGWVPISLVANFNKVKQMTTNIPYILETLRMSFLVEVQGDKIRRRTDWMNWLIRPTKFEADNLTTRFQNVAIEASPNQSPNEVNKSASETNLDDSIQEGEKNGDD